MYNTLTVPMLCPNNSISTYMPNRNEFMHPQKMCSTIFIVNVIHNSQEVNKYLSTDKYPSTGKWKDKLIIPTMEQ